MAKSKKKKAATKKNNPTLKQLQATAKDLNKFMDDVHDGKYKNPIDIKDDAQYLSKNIIGMVKEEMFKQDKDSLTTDSIAVIEELGIKFETLMNDPEQGGEENGRNGKEELKNKKEVGFPKAPVEKKPTKAAPIKKEEIYIRDWSICDVLSDEYQSVDEIAKKSNGLYVKNGGADNIKQSKHTTKIILKPLLRIGYIERDSEGKIRKS